ncbi:MAG: monovalent cation/H+ antiporter subunit D family protein [Alphaproteobacteria bacterium]|nr:monovalent cation/H+ antiporter subunit D family protein [Alphaproteobacteria bacterium]
MSTGETLILATLLLPLFTAGVIRAIGRAEDVRDTITLLAGIALAILCAAMLVRTGEGDAPSLVLAHPLPGLDIAFKLEPLGALFALMSSTLWAVNSLYSFGYMRAKRETNQTRFYMCFALAMAGVMGVAMAGNLFTMFIFYEVLTFATYPLVAHKGDAAARRAGRIYLGILAGASVLLLLPAIIIIYVLAGSTDFVAGGLLVDKAGPATAGLLLALIVFGAAKAALFPVHAWLPNAMVAPAPVSAMLHAVAVVKAGVFVLLKVSGYIFGADLMHANPVTQWLLWLAAATIVIASLVAMTKDEIKARLAWSTIGQLAYITSAALIGGAALTAGGLGMVTHAVGKITLFFGAGVIFAATGVSRVSEMRGLGRRMPLTFGAFLVGSLSVIGLPPFGGMWSKFLLITNAFDAGQPWTAWAMIASSILSTMYLMPIAVYGLLPPTGTQPAAFTLPGGAPRLSLTPIAITATLCLVLFFLAGPIVAFLGPLAGGAR